ncbi:MAG: hypothetical protein ACM3XP_01300, partial [Nitrososphaerales archaeon]
LYSIDIKNPKIHALIEELDNDLHNTESITYPALAYDCFWISSLSLDKNSTSNYFDMNNIRKTFKDIVIETAESFDGSSGKIKLNEAGDRTGGNYDFWTVSKDEQKKGHYIWKIQEDPKGPIH